MTFNFKLRSVQMFFFHAAFATLSLLMFHETAHPPEVLAGIVVALMGYLIIFRRADYLDPLVAFSFPWLMILGFSLLPISGFAIVIHRNTDELVLAVLFAAMMSSGPLENARAVVPFSVTPQPSGRPMRDLYLLDAALVGLTVLNILIAGYVPLVRGIITGDTGYLDFGIHGLYGFYLAFVNAWAILHLFLYLRTRRVAHLSRFLLALVIFVFLVTRQNLLSVLVEGLVVGSILRKRLSAKTMVASIGAMLMLFSLAGSFRSGGIKLLANVRPRYYWIPDPIIWLYSYSYFNLANLDNLLHFSKAPLYDGSSFAQLIPSFLRPVYETESFVEISNFSVSSYLFPVYQDLGAFGAVLLTVLAFKITQRKCRQMYLQPSLYYVGTFATLYFCAAFSFFVNFWFYLPIVFQIVFFRLFSGLADRVTANLTPRKDGQSGLPSRN